MSSNDLGGLTTGANIPRRTFVRGAIVASGAAIGGDFRVFAASTNGSSGSGLGHVSAARQPTGHPVPEAAYVRSFGAVPPGVCSTLGDQQCKTGIPTPGYRNAGAGLSVPGLGIPLGGVGAGSFMINQCGTFGPWNMSGSQSAQFWEMRTLPQAAFHVREEGVGGIAVKTLAAPRPEL